MSGQSENDPEVQKVKYQKMSKPEWVQENGPGVSRPQGGSKLHSESNGMPPGAQSVHEKMKNREIPENQENPGFLHFSIGLYRAL